MAKRRDWITPNEQNEFIEMYQDHDNYFVRDIAAHFNLKSDAVSNVATGLGLELRGPGDHPKKKPMTFHRRRRLITEAMYLISTTNEDTHYQANVEKISQEYNISERQAKKYMARASQELAYQEELDRQAMARKNMRRREDLLKEVLDIGKHSVAATLLGQEARILKLDEVVVSVRQEDDEDRVSIFLPDNGRDEEDSE